MPNETPAIDMSERDMILTSLNLQFSAVAPVSPNVAPILSGTCHGPRHVNCHVGPETRRPPQLLTAAAISQETRPEGA